MFSFFGSKINEFELKKLEKNENENENTSNSPYISNISHGKSK